MSLHRDKRLRQAATLLPKEKNSTRDYDFEYQLKQPPVYLSFVPRLQFQDLVNLCRSSREWKKYCQSRNEIWRIWIDSRQPIFSDKYGSVGFKDETLAKWVQLLETKPENASLETFRYFMMILQSHFQQKEQFLSAYLSNLLAILLQNVQTESEIVPIVKEIVDAGLNLQGIDFKEQLKKLFVSHILLHPLSNRKESRELLEQLWRPGDVAATQEINLSDFSEELDQLNLLDEYESFLDEDDQDKPLSFLQLVVRQGNQTALELLLENVSKSFEKSMRDETRQRKMHLTNLLEFILEGLMQYADKKQSLTSEQISTAIQSSGIGKLLKR